MGTWGAGNTENDTALDIVGEKSDALIKSVIDALNSEESTEADEFAYGLMFLEMEMIFALDAHNLFNGWSLPSTDAFDDAVARWLPLWADYFDGLAGPEFKAERRAVIEETFAKFRSLVVTYEARRNG